MRENIWVLLHIFFDHIDPSYMKEWHKEYPDVYDLIIKLGRMEKEYLVHMVTLLGMMWSDDGRIDGEERKHIKEVLVERKIRLTLRGKWHLKQLFRNKMDIKDVKEFFDHIGFPSEQLLKQIYSIEKWVNRKYTSRYFIFFNDVRNYCENQSNIHAS